jgi:hypothetical protein
MFSSSVPLPLSGFVKVPLCVETNRALIKIDDIYNNVDYRNKEKRAEIQKRFKTVLSEKRNDIQQYKLGNLTGLLNDIVIIDVNVLKNDPQLEDIGADDGFPIFDRLMNKNQVKTLTYSTPTGGRHYYFKYDDEFNKSYCKINGYSIRLLSNANYGVVYDDNIMINEQIKPMPENIKDFIREHIKNKLNKTNKTKGDKKPTNNKKDIANIPQTIEYKYDISDLVKLLNKLPNKYYDNYKEWLLITSALKSANLREQWVTFSMKSNKYDEIKNNKIWDDLAPSVDLMSLLYIKTKEGIRTRFKVKRWCNKLNLFTVEPNEILSVPYVALVKTKKNPDIIDFDYNKHRYILIKSPTGSGKTTCVSDLIDKIRSKYKHRVLSIVSRVSLSSQHIKSFKDIDMKSYKYIEPKEYDKNNLTIQLDSINNINDDNFKNSILVLDEINSMFDYLLNSSTLTNKRLLIYNKLCAIIGHASYIIGVDADLSDIVIKFFKFFDITPYIIHNIYKNASGQKATEYISQDILVDNMKKKLLKGQYFIACFDCLVTQDKITAELEAFCDENKLNHKKDFVKYSSKDGDDAELEDVATTWANKWIYYTPKITYGLDYNPVKPLHVYAFFNCNSVNPLSFSQMIGRCRNIKKFRYYMREKNTSLMFLNPDEIKDDKKDILKYLKQTYDELSPIDEVISQQKKELQEYKLNQKGLLDVRYKEYNPRTCGFEFATSVFDDMYWMQEYYNCVMRSSMNYHFKEILKEKGYTININEETTENKLNNSELKEQIKEKFDNTVERILKNTDDELSASEKKIKSLMKKRAEILNINIDNKKYIEEITNDKKFATHINICKLLNISQDKQFIKKLENETLIKSAESITTKLKLINEVQTILNISPLRIDKIDNNIDIPEDKKKIIKNAFRTTPTIIKMYEHIAPDIIVSSQKSINGKKHRVYEINEKLLKHHLDLLCHRNGNLKGISEDIIKHIKYKIPKKTINFNKDH